MLQYIAVCFFESLNQLAVIDDDDSDDGADYGECGG